MKFQVAVISYGYKASTYFRKYPGRFISAHLADWSSDTDTQVAVGKGIVNWTEFFDPASTGGIRNIYIGMDMDKLKDSIAYFNIR